MKTKILITGVTSGIGLALAESLLEDGCYVWGIARREKLLKETKNTHKNNLFDYCAFDLIQNESWSKVISQMKRKRFIPQVVIFNAAILEDDLKNGIDLKITRQIFETNYFSILNGIVKLLPYVKKGTQFIGISSVSALKGNTREGIGYSGSKSSLNLAFETLQQKYKHDYHFTIVSFGPVLTGMNPYKESQYLSLSEEDAVCTILKATIEKKQRYEKPMVIFMFVKFLKILPQNISNYVFTKIENLRKNVT